MPQIISIVNQKGGVGKTTTAINLGAALAAGGKRVLLADIDPQANATSGLGADYRNIAASIYHALLGEIPAGAAIIETSQENYKLLPASPELAGAAIELVNMDRREFKLKDLVSDLSASFDYILIDCPPSLGLLTINALMASNSILIPVQAEYYALEGLGQLLNTIGLIQTNMRSDLVILGSVVTMYDKRNKLCVQVFDELKQYFPYRVFNTFIPRSVRLSESPSHGQTIFQYAPDSPGAQAYKELADEVIKLGA
ncbi:MAG: ParA family protein [Parcubacteria group bacterium]|nr:ParA family protein [Parcubacteria group bacterium]